MWSQWIIFIPAVILAIVLLNGVESSTQNTPSLLEEGNEQLTLLLEAINELERQRVKESIGETNANSDTIKRRPNSKRLRWTRRRTLPDPEEPELSENRAFAAYSSSTSNQPNPDYLDWKDYQPTPAPWWFN
ncbi:hypothetical protein KR009_002469 [Drosophila setifemur]|nr:hypothetical protein KR009_002469 [Drosophila setifemur]